MKYYYLYWTVCLRNTLRGFNISVSLVLTCAPVSKFEQPNKAAMKSDPILNMKRKEKKKKSVK